ncbi:MAG: tetratricopeptide repeat protein [Sedimentisphaerales bacterium]|nr:tetratricopeptide repeat protein [Sedimentisphaerales bacterium]
MRPMRPKTLGRLALLFGGVLCVLGVAGCTQSAASGSGVDSTSASLDLQFQKNRNPQPTPKTLYAMAEILAAQGKDSDCEVVLRKIIEEHPGFFPAYNSLAELFMRNGRTKEAVDIIHEGLRIHPTDPVLLNNAGMCWIMRRKYDKALDMFTQAAGRMPENARYRANMAVALGLMGRNEESLALFTQILPEDQAKHNLDVLCRSRKTPEAGSQEKGALLGNG